MNSSFVSLSVSDGSMMRAYVSQPSSSPVGGLLLFQEAYGVNAYIRSVADRFAAEGYLVVAPELFHRTAGDGFEAAYTDFETVRPHFSALSEPGLEADARAAFDWLKTAGVENVSSLGFCMGGRVSFIANSILPLKCAISFYGGGIDALVSRIPSLHAPMLFFWGGEDMHITRESRQVVREALEAAQASYVETTFADAGHGFFCDARASFHQRSAELAWPLVLEFLK